MSETFIVADIAGEFDALMRLVEQAPKGCPILAVGDICDRGLRSADVIEWLMTTPNADAVAGNHEHMMIDYFRNKGMYGKEMNGKHIWLYPGNGGNKTVKSYYRPPWSGGQPPERHLRWLETRDFYKMIGQGPGCLVTHAPLNSQMELWAANEACNVTSVYHPDFDKSLMWNRRHPTRRSFFQVFGHCAEWGLRPFYPPGDDRAYAICIDQSHKQILTAFHWPTGEIFEEPYELPKEREPEVSL